MGWFKSEPKETPRETTDEEEAEARLKFHTASGRFGPVGRRDRTWKTSSE
jgi:hypothetical protein